MLDVTQVQDKEDTADKGSEDEEEKETEEDEDEVTETEEKEEKEEEGKKEEDPDEDKEVWHLSEDGEKIAVGSEDIFSWIEAERAELERYVLTSTVY